MELWTSGNAEARILALQVSDPQRLTRADADRLLGEGQTHFLGCYLAGLIGRSPIARETMRSWMASSDSLSDADAGEILETIENEIHASPNWARHAMNGALISIGVYRPACRNRAIDAAKRVGKVEVDHGGTNCKTRDALPYIEKSSKPKRCP